MFNDDDVICLWCNQINWLIGNETTADYIWHILACMWFVLLYCATINRTVTLTWHFLDDDDDE